MACIDCNSGVMLINRVIPWITVCILVASAVLFRRILKRSPGMWTFLVMMLVLTEEVILSLWLLSGDVQLLSPNVMGVM